MAENLLTKLGCGTWKHCPKKNIYVITNYAKLKRDQDFPYDSSIINDEEFVLLYDNNPVKSPDFPYWNYEAFGLDNMSDEECQAEFGFYNNDVYDFSRDIYMLEWLDG